MTSKPLPLTVEVTPGSVRVNEVSLWHDTSHLKMLHVDLHTKRCEVYAIGSDPRGYDVWLGTTKKQDPDGGELTRIKIVGAGPEWRVDAVENRYAVHVFLWRDPEDAESEPLWSAETEEHS